MALAIIVSLMTVGAPALAGLDIGGPPTHVVVSYETNGGSTIDFDHVSSGGKLVFQRTPVKDCYSFAGWYYDSALTQAYNASDQITRNLTLYAKWTATSANAQCSFATLTSTIGTVSTGGTANETITVGNGIQLAALKAAITPSKDATFEIYNADGVTKATTLKTGTKIIVISLVGTSKVIYTVTVSSPNLALNKPATVGSTCSATQNAAKVVDGSVTNDSHWCSLSSNRWLQVDLGSVQQVSQFLIKHASEGGLSASYNTKAYNIQVSSDGTNWSEVVKVNNNTSGVTVDNIPHAQAHYIKLNVTTPTQTVDSAARIYEFEVYEHQNLALNKPATVDSTCNASQTAAKAVDGSVTNDSKWCSLSSNRWLQVDLGSVKQVNQFIIKHAAEGGETASYNTKAYNIQTSSDGKNWSEVVKVTNNTNSQTEDNIAPVSARYIKLNVTTPTQTTNRAARIYDFQVYGPQNLALNKPATVDSTCTTTQTAAKAVDGNVNNDSKWCSKSNNRWLQVDLGSVKQVNQFVIKHASEGGETASYNTKAYDIQVSTDGVKWSSAVKATNNTSGITVDKTTVVPARFIKLNVTTPTQTQNAAARIFEFEVYGPQNLALNKPATASNTCNASQTAAKAVDGIVTNDSKWCSLSGDRWLQIDLGSVEQVNQFVIKHASEGGERASYNTKAYNIQVSNDGTNWTKVVNVTNNASGITVDNITGATARYIKLNVTTGTQTAGTAARIFEFEVYGTNATP
ncbi:discoidin domain-containing protein [Paenibacillus sp. PAMC21692]|uniref:discoidin domain-containing protein n=1 Tax=Paenibacillus sp. PAMC21692 TaxID=2762320 RepID=UPI00164D158E|nr:discoidin domain-containing protein [Paenibacillus sp. PAMC21692]QNK56923.1 discoidin domain-containing protein [Paenibacillus sp. PAMC21692]